MRGRGLVSFLLLVAAVGLAPATARRGTDQSEQQQVLLPPFPENEEAHARNDHEPKIRDFTLRHIYHKGSHLYPNLLRVADVHPDSTFASAHSPSDQVTPYPKSFRVSSKPMSILRLADRDPQHIDKVLDLGQKSLHGFSLPSRDWSTDSVDSPNTTDMQTITSFAYMAADAYILEPGTGDWKDIKHRFNYTQDFGWENDGLRGHIFADTTNSTIVIGLKGTSLAVFDGADTTGNDKLNDNLFGSCCCGQGGQYFWKSVCDCQTDTYTCNNTCLLKSLYEKSHYYHAAKDLYLNVTAIYPDADVWLTGHSLGGVVTSLLGLTYGLPTLTFEAFPDALAASRLGLPTPPGYHVGSHQKRASTGITHFGHTADPVYMGTCNSASSACTIGGYAFQSQCHTGQTCTFDTVGDFGWRVGIRTHAIQSVIKDVLPKYKDGPSCQEDIDCDHGFVGDQYCDIDPHRNVPDPGLVGVSRRINHDQPHYPDECVHHDNLLDPGLVWLQGDCKPDTNHDNYHRYTHTTVNDHTHDHDHDSQVCDDFELDPGLAVNLSVYLPKNRSKIDSKKT